MSNINTNNDHDVFAVTIPWGIHHGSDIQINEFEMDIIALQQHIIDGLQTKITQLDGHASNLTIALQQHIIDKQAAQLNTLDQQETIVEAAPVVQSEIVISETEEFQLLQQQYDELLKRNKDMNTNFFEALSAKSYAERLQKEAIEQSQVTVVELNHTKSELGKLQAEHRAALSQLKQYQEEIRGIPNLVKNKVATALAQVQANTNAQASSELEKQNAVLQAKVAELTDKLAKSGEKNKELNAASATHTKELKQIAEHNKALSQLVESQAELIQVMDESFSRADNNYHLIMHHLEELQGFSAILAAENTQLKEDNLYLDQIRAYHSMQKLWTEDQWSAFFLAKTSMLVRNENDNLPEPDDRFGILLLLNLDKGVGHTCYFSTSGELCFPKRLPKSVVLPTEYCDSLREAAMAVPVKEMKAALANSVERSRKVMEYAKALDITFDTSAQLTEIARRLDDYVPTHEFERVFNASERAKLLMPRNNDLIERINHRFGTNYPLFSTKSVPLVKAKSAALKTTKRKKR